MAERTLPQVATELQQVREKISKLEMDIEAQRDKALDLSQELADMMSETLGAFGKTMDLRNKDGLPQKERTRAPRGTATPANPNKERNAMIRAWAANNNIAVPAKGKIPDNIVAQYEAANPAN